MKFSDLNLIPPILKAAAEAGYEEPSPIQQKAIPPVLAGRPTAAICALHIALFSAA